MSLAELGRPGPAVDTLQQPLLLDQPQHVRDAISVTQDAVRRAGLGPGRLWPRFSAAAAI